MTTRYQGKEDAVRSVLGTNVFNMRRFLSEVVGRSYAGFGEERAAEYARREASDDILDAIALLFMKPVDDSLLRDMGIGLCISIQSIWERGFRRYVGACAQQIPDEGALKQSKSLKWEQVKRGFESVHGTSFESFAEHETLELLQLMGNVCRHGPGISLERLMVERPEFWPNGVKGQDPYDSMRALLITKDHLSNFAEATITFWTKIDHVLYRQQYTEEQRKQFAAADEAYMSEGLDKARDRFRAGLVEHLLRNNPSLRIAPPKDSA